MQERAADRIREEAHAWRARQAEGPLPPAERAAFEAWRESDPRHAAAFARAEAVWEGLGRLEADDLSPDLLRPSGAERALRGVRRAAVAAAVVLAVVTAVVWRPPSDAPPQRFATARGELSATVLADGSRVTLGAETSLRVGFRPEHRRVELLAGEAYFEVASDPQRPFEVHAGETRVRALGTAFEVRRRGAHTTVAVGEGVVSVVRAKAEAPPDASRAVRLERGQQIATSAAFGLGEAAPVRSDAVAAWREGRLVYASAPLAEVVADANRYHDRAVVLEDPGLAAIEVTASFRAEDIDGMLGALAEVFPIVLDRSGAEIRIVGRP